MDEEWGSRPLPEFMAVPNLIRDGNAVFGPLSESVAAIWTQVIGFLDMKVGVWRLGAICVGAGLIAAVLVLPIVTSPSFGIGSSRCRSAGSAAHL